MNNNVLVISALIAFVGVATLGFLAMSENMGNGHIVCFAMIGAATCPQEINILDSLTVHLNAVRVVNSAFLVSAFALKVLVLAWLIFLSYSALTQFADSPLFQTRINTALISHCRTSFLQWLSFREHSPTFS